MFFSYSVQFYIIAKPTINQTHLPTLGRDNKYVNYKFIKTLLHFQVNSNKLVIRQIIRSSNGDEIFFVFFGKNKRFTKHMTFAFVFNFIELDIMYTENQFDRREIGFYTQFAEIIHKIFKKQLHRCKRYRRTGFTNFIEDSIDIEHWVIFSSRNST